LRKTNTGTFTYGANSRKVKEKVVTIFPDALDMARNRKGERWKGVVYPFDGS